MKWINKVLGWFGYRWHKITNWFENDDLIPLIIIIVIPHFGTVLDKYEWTITAWTLGFLVDLGHYRTVKAYMNTPNLWGVLFMIIMTFITLVFHIEYYIIQGMTGSIDVFGVLIVRTIFFGSVTPALLFSLAYLSYKESLGKRAEELSEDEESSGNLQEVLETFTHWRSMPEVIKHELPEMDREQMENDPRFPVNRKTYDHWEEYLERDGYR